MVRKESMPVDSLVAVGPVVVTLVGIAKVSYFLIQMFWLCVD
jgi:hypothetical protein